MDALASGCDCAGQCARCAGKIRLRNKGEQHILGLTTSYQKAKMRYQVAEVSRPLNSVGETCDRNNLVIFSASGGCVLSLETGAVTEFDRRGGLYTMDFWVPNPGSSAAAAAAGFTRQGK